jgi:hypothetical protein
MGEVGCSRSRGWSSGAAEWRSLVVPAAPMRSALAPLRGPQVQQPQLPPASRRAPRAPPMAPAAPGVTALLPAPSPVSALCATALESSRRQSPSALVAVVSSRSELVPSAPSLDEADELRFRRLSRLAWATLYQRVFDVDPLECSGCGGRLRFVEVIENPVRARSELRRRNLPTEPPPQARARSPDGVD